MESNSAAFEVLNLLSVVEKSEFDFSKWMLLSKTRPVGNVVVRLGARGGGPYGHFQLSREAPETNASR